MSRRVTRKLSSPAADLLRGSRVFALPTPLPPPDLGQGNASNIGHGSATATQAYPTHQAIATPNSSLFRGDWGLKRPLPLRATTKSSTPSLRIRAIDTIEHFTDFESAGDHVKSLEKWQELNMPISVHVERQTMTNTEKKQHYSVFEDKVDNTRLKKEEKGEKAKWKYEGPWIAGMNAGEFEYFLKYQVRGRKLEFRQYLRELLSQHAFEKRKAELGDEGERETVESLSREDFNLNDAQFEERLKALREDTTLRSELSQSISEFFDLPAVSDGESTSANTFLNAVPSGTSADKGPPRTHPSAGLSYLRSNAIMENHPLLGPRASASPVEARVLSTRSSSESKNYGRLGVGGFVAKFDEPVTAAKSKQTPVDEPGGPKLWTELRHARVDPHGRVELDVATAVPEDVYIKQGRLGPEEEIKQRPDVEPLRLDDALDDQGTGEPAVGHGVGLRNLMREHMTDPTKSS